MTVLKNGEAWVVTDWDGWKLGLTVKPGDVLNDTRYPKFEYTVPEGCTKINLCKTPNNLVIDPVQENAERAE